MDFEASDVNRLWMTMRLERERIWLRVAYLSHPSKVCGMCAITNFRGGWWQKIPLRNRLGSISEGALFQLSGIEQPVDQDSTKKQDLTPQLVDC